MPNADSANQIALIDAEIAAIDSELDVIYKDKLSSFESPVDQPYQPDMKHQDKVVQKGMGGAEAKQAAIEAMEKDQTVRGFLLQRQKLSEERERLSGRPAAPLTDWSKKSAQIRYFR